jgi:hypothetical protein
MTDDAPNQDGSIDTEAGRPTVNEDPDTPLARLLELAEERPLTVEDFLTARSGGDPRP